MVCLWLSGSLIDFLREKPADWSQCGENEAGLGFSLQGLEALARMTSNEMATDYSQVEKEGPWKVPAGVCAASRTFCQCAETLPERLQTLNPSFPKCS